jgi:hypothetical protein
MMTVPWIGFRTTNVKLGGLINPDLPFVALCLARSLICVTPDRPP